MSGMAKLLDSAAGAIEFSVAEFHAIHAVCDRLNIVRTADLQRLSASQRVAILAAAFEGLVGHVGRGNPTGTLQ